MVIRPTKLLIVDDSALMRKMLRDLFGSTGRFETQTARNGADALEQIERFNPDVVTLDVNMPEMDGLTCLSHIMARFAAARRDGVFDDAEAARRRRWRRSALGAVDFVEKPGGTVRSTSRPFATNS